MILIDDRTGSKELAPYITSPHKIQRLDFADFSFIGNGPENIPISIGIERKTINDLISSMESGRLSGHQLLGLLSSYSYIYILIEGIWRGSNSGILEVMRGKRWFPVSYGKRMFMARDINTYLNSISILCDLKIWRTENKEQTGQWVSNIYGWWQKKWTDHKSMKQFNAPPLPKRAYFFKPGLLQRMIKEISGLGWDKSELLIKQFESLTEVLCATEKDLTAIPGIGKVLAKKIRKELDSIL